MKIINTYNRPIPKETNNGLENISLNAILTQDCCKKLVVYIGFGSNEFLLRNGQKLSYKEALHYFPMMKQEDYRN